MSLTVLSVAFPFAPVGPDAVGGAEQIVAALDEGITQAGYRSLVVACEGSKTHGKLFATPPVLELCDELATRRAHARHRETIERALAEERVDVVHFHGHDFHRYLPRAQAPMVATLHLAPSAYPEEILRRPPDRMRLVCVSASQRARMPEGAARVELINNGVALDRLRPGLGKRAFVIALGRICPEKGFHLALDAAARGKAPMLLGGEVFGYDAHRRYFEDAIAPRLDARRRFLGPVSAPRKRRLLAAARCLLVPSLCEETSSLVAMEALACGTPVIAFAAGALAEIVEHGETGFLVKSVDEMAARIADIDSIDPAVCRRRARRARRAAARSRSKRFEASKGSSVYTKRGAISGRAAPRRRPFKAPRGSSPTRGTSGQTTCLRWPFGGALRSWASPRSASARGG